MPGDDLVADLVGLGEPDPRLAPAPVDERDPTRPDRQHAGRQRLARLLPSSEPVTRAVDPPPLPGLSADQGHHHNR
jgi:hypothetical protein